ncbi:hypothetical protein D6817_04715 [Candidatus Pacearchaeota archaeon]|nr:MAG: hypothetical protein D6817_04715 [Candidatus Pacearchaeota archaeon]
MKKSRNTEKTKKKRKMPLWRKALVVAGLAFLLEGEPIARYVAGPENVVRISDYVPLTTTAIGIENNLNPMQAFLGYKIIHARRMRKMYITFSPSATPTAIIPDETRLVKQLKNLSLWNTVVGIKPIDEKSYSRYISELEENYGIHRAGTYFGYLGCSPSEADDIWCEEIRKTLEDRAN